MRIANFGAGGNRVFAEKTEVKIHGVLHYAGVISDNQIDTDNFAGVSLLSIFKRKP
jgi:hypothetical protein